METEIWYRATIYGSEAEAVEVVKRSDRLLWIRGRKGVTRACIRTTWAQYFPTLDDALAFIGANQAKRQAAAGASRQVEACRRTAPKLYEALELILADKGNHLTAESHQLGMAALAGARGELLCALPTH